MCRCSIFARFIEFCKQIACLSCNFIYIKHLPRHTTNQRLLRDYCRVFFLLLLLYLIRLSLSLSSCEYWCFCCCFCSFCVCPVCLSVPYFTFHTNSIHSTIRHRTNFHRNTQKRNITIHLTDILHIWYTYWYCWLILTLIHVKEFRVYFFAHASSIVYRHNLNQRRRRRRNEKKKPSFLLRCNVLMFMFSYKFVFAHMLIVSTLCTLNKHKLMLIKMPRSCWSVKVLHCVRVCVRVFEVFRFLSLTF